MEVQKLAIAAQSLSFEQSMHITQMLAVIRLRQRLRFQLTS